MNEIKKVLDRVKEKKQNFFLSKLREVADYYWDKWIDIRKGGYDVNIKNAEDIKTVVDFSSLEFPKEFSIKNADEIAKYIVIPKNEKFPGAIKISNLSELSKYLEVREKVEIPNAFKIDNLKDLPKTEFPDNLKKLSLKKTEELLMKLAKQLAKEKIKDEVFIKNKKPEEYIPVRIVDRKGKDFLESFGNSLLSLPSKMGIKNVAGQDINPATKEKQDSIITAIEAIPGTDTSLLASEETLQAVADKIPKYDMYITYNGDGTTATKVWKTAGTATVVATLTYNYSGGNLISKIIT